jgi:predicted DNA-binding transcriptional regulator AlpA
MTEVPAYLSKKKLAEQLDVAESTIDELVKNGKLPRRFHLSNGCVRWSWQEVDAAIKSLGGSTDVTDLDPYIVGARHAMQKE